MAMSKPVVAFAVGGVAEMLDAETGQLVPFEAAGEGESGASDGSVRLLAKAFVRYVRDPGLRARQGTAARERVLRDFDARAHAARIQREIAIAADVRVR
jgi:glycosyltransferase involved in cell wall biosynthesis